MKPSPSTRTTRNQGRASPFRSFLSRRMHVVATAALLCWAGTLGAAVAQTSDAPGGIQSARPCVAKPEDQANGGNGKADKGAQPLLSECGGVLAPPKTGDQEMRIEPPDTGTTPVIPPGALPAQPPK